MIALPTSLRAFGAVVLLCLPGCVSSSWGWEPTPTPGAHEVVRITRTDGSHLILEDAHISRDSLFGFIKGCTSQCVQSSIALSGIRAIEAEKEAPVWAEAFGTLLVGGVFEGVTNWSPCC